MTRAGERETGGLWGRIFLAAYAPTLLVATGLGAIIPLVALSARSLGADVGTAAFIVALTPIGQLVGDLPAGAIAARFGDKRALIGASLVEALALTLAWQADSLVVLGLAVFLSGLAGSVVGLARQAFLTEIIPIHQRARALSTLGGMLRIGYFLGPLIGAFVVGRFSLSAAYAVAALLSLSAAVLVTLIPDIESRPGTAATQGGRARVTGPSLSSIVAAHRKVLATLGLGALIIMLGRAARQALIPLWSDQAGLDPQATSLIYAVSAFADMAVFYPSGVIMDRFGRFWAAFPTLCALGIGFGLLPLAHGPIGIGLVAFWLGLANGFSAGVVMTMGSDASPAEGRQKFLGAWRLMTDAGSTGGPLLISAVVAFAPLWTAALVIAATCWFGAGWFWKWLPRGRPPLNPVPASPNGSPSA